MAKQLADLQAYAKKRHCEVYVMDRGERFQSTQSADRFEVWMVLFGPDGERRSSGKESKAPTRQEAIDLAWDSVKKEADRWTKERW